MTNEEIKAKMWEAFEAGIINFQMYGHQTEEEKRKDFNNFLADDFPELVDQSDIIEKAIEKLPIALPNVTYPGGIVHIKWHVRAGSKVTRDQVICEFDADKATFEINADKSGTLEIILQGDVNASAEDIIGYIT